jgi:hypothetical protein
MAKERSSRQSGGVNFGKGSTVTVGGDIVGRDKIAGVTGDQLVKMFEPVLSVIEKAPAGKQSEAEAKVKELQEQLKAKEPDLGIVGKSLKWLKQNVPGVSTALNTVLNQPIIGKAVKDIAAVILDD